MAYRACESESSAPRLTFARRLKLEFYGTARSSYTGGRWVRAASYSALDR